MLFCYTLLLLCSILIHILLLRGTNTMESDSEFQEPLAKYETKTEKNERMYLKYIFLHSQNDLICSLPKSKKVTLCQNIFHFLIHRNLKIHSNKVAFFLNTLACEEKVVAFKKTEFFLDKKIQQKMIPCYGRHYPTRTNYIIDDYYDKIYISAGLTENSIIVFIRGYDRVTSWYSIYSYIDNIQFLQLKGTFISIHEVVDELKFNRDLIWHSNRDENLEYIYLYEKERDNSEEDALCQLEEGKKIALCQLMFDRYVYKELFWIKINKLQFIFFKAECSTNTIKIRSLKFYKNKLLKQKSFGCFSQNRLSIGFNNILFDSNSIALHISEGPREGSAFVYIFHGDGPGYLMELIENIDINVLESIDFTKEDTLDPYSGTEELWKKFDKLTPTKNSLYLLKMSQTLFKKLEDFNFKKKNNLVRNRNDKDNFKHNNYSKFVFIRSIIFTIWKDYEDFLYLKKGRKILSKKKQITADEVAKDVDDSDTEIQKLIDGIEIEMPEEASFRITVIMEQDTSKLIDSIVSFIKKRKNFNYS